MPRLIDHLERFLGPIEEGWSVGADGRPQAFQVVRFSPAVLPQCSVYVTVGLSRHDLTSRTSSRRVKQELVAIVSDEFRPGPIPGVLQQVGEELVRSGSALLRGDVVGPRGRLVEGSEMEGLYAAIPVYLPDGFGQVDDVVMVWAVPISRREAEFVSVNGWPLFEERLIDVDPDLTDLHRRSMFR